jgi:hypothetical protein
MPTEGAAEEAGAAGEDDGHAGRVERRKYTTWNEVLGGAGVRS